MAKTQFLNYTIYLTDAVLVGQLQGAVHAGGAVGATIMAPTDAATLYSAPIQEWNTNATYPSIRSEWFAGSNNFPRNVRTFDRCNGGWFGICFLFGTTTHYYWRGTWAFVPKLDAPFIAGQTVLPIAKRRWVDGAEMPQRGEAGSGTMKQNANRGASRHLQGYGYKFDSTTTQVIHTPTENGDAATNSLWERFYIRFWRFDTGKVRIWKTNGSVSTTAGVELGVNASGQLVLTNIDSGGGEQNRATSANAIPVGIWKKIDIVYIYTNSGPSSPRNVIVWVNGVEVMGYTAGGPDGGIGQAQNISQSIMGPASANKLTFDVDDWTGRTGNTDFYTSSTPLGIMNEHDWENGSRVAFVSADGFGSDHAAGSWTGDWRLLRQRPEGNVVLEALTGSTSGARLTIATDAAREIDNQIGGVGIAAMTIGCFNMKASGAIDGKLGYRLPGQAAVMATVVQANAGVPGWNNVWYQPTGLLVPLTPLAGLELIFDHAISAILTSIQCLGAAVEVIGKFGQEDVTPLPYNPATQTPTPAVTAVVQKPMAGYHNAPFPHSPWARKGTAPFSPFAIVGGTYVGNGTFQDLVFRQPVHWVWIRPLSGGSGGVEWWSTMVMSRQGGKRGNNAPGPTALVEVLIDPAFGFPTTDPALNAQEQRTLVRLVGAQGDVNANGVTYQYVAVCDPGQRFLTGGILSVYAGTADVVTALINDSFTPEAVFLMQEQDTNVATVGMHYKGLGHAADNVSPLNAAEIAGLRMANGTLTSKSALSAADIAQISYMAFRRADGNNDAGQPAVLQLANYLGDGSASRTINFAPASGKRPLWAMVIPHNGAAVYRDPSHTGSTSTTFPNSANAATGITGAGIDSISVGSALNTNGVTYDVFVLPGDSTAGNGGFSINGEFQPVAPDSPIAGNSLWDATPADPELSPNEPTGAAAPGVEPTLPDGQTSLDFETTCVGDTTFIVNQALSRIGVSKQVGTITTELSDEAVTARLHYLRDVTFTLRRWPWPFATRYARLTLVAGTDTVPAVAGEWQFSYRAPSDSIFNRRIVSLNNVHRAFDPSPVKFRVGSDATGPLIYTDQGPDDDAGLTPLLEYTVRPTCAASQGDEMFRDALIWKHASSLAPAIAKDQKKAEFCLVMFERIFGQATVAAAQEKQQANDGDVDWIRGRDE